VLRSLSFWAVALTILVGATALFLNFRNKQGSGVRFPFPETARREVPRMSAVTEQPLSAQREAVPSTQVSESAPQVRQDQAASEQFGSITGSVFDFSGKPLAHRNVAFYAPGDLSFAKRVRACSDDNGYYTIERIPVGHWTAYYLGSQGNQEAPLLLSGEVDIHANQMAALDFVLLGERRLSGAFALAEQDLVNMNVPEGRGVSLQLELRSRWQPDVIVAKGTAQTLRKGADSKPSDPRKADVPETPRGVGRFEMTGLEAGQYTLRIMVPGRAKDSSGKFVDLYIEKEVDLVQADLTLPSEELSLAQFVEVSLADRNSKRMTAAGGGRRRPQ